MQLWRLGAYVLGVLVLLAVMLGVPQLVGERVHTRHGPTPYEGGIAVTGTARVRMSAQYYLVAMLFVVFDLEAAFLFAWAVAGRELGWVAYFEVLFFSGVLLATLAYLWRVGALDWGTTARMHRERAERRARRALESSRRGREASEARAP